jgi:hypothetical protein
MPTKRQMKYSLIIIISISFNCLGYTVGEPPPNALERSLSTIGTFLCGPEKSNDSLGKLRGFILPLSLECSGMVVLPLSFWVDRNSNNPGEPYSFFVFEGSFLTIPGGALLIQNPKSKAGWLYLFAASACVWYTFSKPFTDDKAVRGLFIFQIPRILGAVKAYHNYEKWKRK